MNKIKKDKLKEVLGMEDNVVFPKYVSGLLNMAMNTSRGNNAKNIGHVSTEIQEFDANHENGTKEEFESFLESKFPNRDEFSIEKTYSMIDSLKQALELIDREMVVDYVENMKKNTWYGLKVQDVLLETIAKERGVGYRLANQEEEAKGIDGYVGDQPYQVKPKSHKSMGRLGEAFDCPVIYYDKVSDGVKYEIVG